MRRLACVGMLTLLAGCMTSPVTERTATPVPDERAWGYQQAVPGGATVAVMRDAGAFGSGCYFGVFVNGEAAARIAPGEIVRFQLKAGEHLIGMGGDPAGRALCSLDGVPFKEVQATLSPGQTRKYRLSGDMGAGFSISPTSF